MDGITKKTVAETLKAVQEYMDKLTHLKDSIVEAEDQVTKSAKRSREQVANDLDKLSTFLNATVEKRKQELLKQVDLQEEKGSQPLRECELVINAKLTETQTFLNDLRNILKIGGVSSDVQAGEFFNQSSRLGSLPAVPDLETVPNITFNCSLDSTMNDLYNHISVLGKVTKMGPIQISNFLEKPGSILVQWEEADQEFQIDSLCFKLQMAYGDIRNNIDIAETNFHDIYIGSELECLVRGLTCGTLYTFRVCCQTEDNEWSAWSLLKISQTNVGAFCFEDNTKSYLVTNEGKFATKTQPETEILFSHGPQLTNGSSIQLHIVNCADRLSDEGIFLSTSKISDSEILQKNVLFFNSEGKIFIDGVPKLTVLPKLKKDSKIIFSCESVKPNLLRIHIEHEAKAVTYFWETNVDKLYFGLILTQPGFTVSVS